jgi:quinol monooxygenase YgiN
VENGVSTVNSEGNSKGVSIKAVAEIEFMIVVQSTFQLNPDSRSEVLALMRQMVTQSRKEPGCISYEYFVGLSDNCQVVLMQEWKSAEFLQLHYQTKHMEEFVLKLGNYLQLPIVTRSFASPDEELLRAAAEAARADQPPNTIH